MKKIIIAMVSVFLLIFSGTAMAINVNTAVDLELALLVDVSGSISDAEFDLQKQGYVDAFNGTSVWNKVSQGAIGKIAANLIYWSSENQQITAVDWMLIDSQATSQAFAAAIDAYARPYSNYTGIGAALKYGADSFANDFDGTRQVIDISGDGANNEATAASVGRDYALNGDVDTINGIVIGGSASVLNHYTTQVIGGTNAFAMAVNDFASFGAAVERKIIREIDPIPEPTTMVLFGFGLLGLAGVSRRKK